MKHKTLLPCPCDKRVRTVLGDVVEVIPTDDDGAGHLGGNDTASQDTTADGNITSEGALLV